PYTTLFRSAHPRPRLGAQLCRRLRREGALREGQAGQAVRRRALGSRAAVSVAGGRREGEGHRTLRLLVHEEHAGRDGRLRRRDPHLRKDGDPSMSFADVKTEAHVATVTLRATGKAPRMGGEFWKGMPDLFAKLDADDAVRVVILRGEGEHFSFGLDLATMASDVQP